MTKQNPIGILLINLGTPKSPSISDVRHYLREFLSDPRVVDLPAIVRSILLNCCILPFRPKKTAHAYQQIWTEQGSPLLHHSQQFTNAIAQKLRDNHVVTLGMRYGKPSIEMAVTQLLAQSCREILVLPLFPQYSSAATGSAIEKTLAILKAKWNIPSIKIMSDFHDHPLFINAYAKVIQEHKEQHNPDFILFSFHGLPQRHLDKSECKRHTVCEKNEPCPARSPNLFCYRRQCYQTSRALAKALALNDSEYAVAFQSRLGKTPWIQPYTDILLNDLAKRGIKKLAVACPSFVVDCLETLEEIGIRGNQQWISLTGESIQLIPCLNSHPVWVDAVAKMAENNWKSSYNDAC